MNKIEIIRSYRRTIAVEIKKDLRIIVRAPIGVSKSQINNFITDKMPWIEKHLEIVKNKNANEKEYEYFTEIELKGLKEKANIIMPTKVQHYANVIGVKYNNLSIKAQSTRWGSCSTKGNLNFNCLLMLCPESVVDYVIIHELCHLKYMNHSKSFWLMVGKFYPNYKMCNKWLRTNGKDIIRRLAK